MQALFGFVAPGYTEPRVLRQHCAPFKMTRGSGLSQMRIKSAAFFATRHNRGVQAITQAGGHFVDFVRAIDLDSLSGGVEGYFAVRTTVQMILQFGACFRAY